VKAKFTLPILLAIAISVVMTFLYFESHSPATKHHNEIITQIELIKHTNFELNESIFEMASGQTYDYDTISLKQQQLSSQVQQLIKKGNGLEQRLDLLIDETNNKITAAVTEKNKRVEHFKRDLSFINNSLQYYPRLITEINNLKEKDNAYLPYHNLIHNVIYFAISQNKDSLEKARIAINNLKANLTKGIPKDKSKHLFLANFLAHSDVILNTRSTKVGLASVSTTPTINTLLSQLHDAYMDYYITKTDGANEYRQVMFIASLLLIAIVSYMLILLGRSAIELAKQKENALAANRAKSAFLANMSHEIRTPLTAIIGFGESTLDSNQNVDERLSAIKSIVRNGKHLLHLINEILDISKIESGKLTIEILPTNLFEILSDIESLAGREAKNKGLEFSIHHNFPLPEKITTDPIRLKQILLNLCNNAIKFTERGHVKVVVSCNRELQHIKFTIIDTGIGLSPQQINKLFTPFTQADSSTTRKYGGTGLGLHISKLLIENLDGKLKVSSTLNQGSQFEFYINAGDLNDSRFISKTPAFPSGDSKSAINPEVPQLIGRILLAEDNTDNQALISYFIRKTGASIKIAENGAIALQNALDTEFDLILMDVQMPEMDGLEATKQLRQAGYLKPIVALTANATHEDTEECYQAGCNKFLSKPVNWNLFYQTLAEYLPTKQSSKNKAIPIKTNLLINDPEILKLIVALLGALPERLEHISNALEQRDWETLVDHLHQLKGVGGNFGYPQLTKLSTRMECEAKQHGYDTISASCKELKNLISNMRAGAPKSA